MAILTYNSVKDKDTTFISMTSLTVEEFEILYISFLKTFDEHNKENGYDSSKGGRKTILDKKNMLFFILFYLKTYPIQRVIAHLFGMSQPQANYWIHKLCVILNKTLKKDDHIPKRASEELIQKLEEEDKPDVSIDASERRTNRPKDNIEQKKKYSGKKKAHTIKNNIIVGNNDRQVKYLGQTHEGRIHDKKICDIEKTSVPKGTNLFRDSAYIGHEMEEVNIYEPIKKQKGKELSDDDKEYNCLISSIRVVVENVISGIKRCRIVKDIYRNTKEGFDDVVMLLACGLHNFRSYQRHHSY